MSTQQEWQGSPLTQGRLALSLHTSVVGAPSVVATPVLAAASSGHFSCIIRPEQLGAFLRVHAECQLVCYGAAGDHWSLHDYFHQRGEVEVLRALWNFSRSGRLHDVVLLDQLVRMAEGRYFPHPRTLKELAAGLADLDPPEEQELSVRCGMAAGRNWEQIDHDLFGPACRTADAIYGTFQILSESAGRITQRFHVDASAIARFGLLGLGLQVKGAIALARATQNGLRLDQECRDRLLVDCESLQRTSLTVLGKNSEARRCFKQDAGRIRLARDGGPEARNKTLDTWLTKTLGGIRALHGLRFTPVTSPQGIAKDPQVWGVAVRCHSVLSAWADLAMATTLRRCLRRSSGPALHPQYEVLPRIESFDPNLDAVRRTSKGILRPRDGRSFLVLRIHHLELRALAAVCERRFGHSQLACLFRDGTDPERYTGAHFLGLDLARFRDLEASDPDRFNDSLRLAKAFHFAAPRMLGEQNAKELARRDFGVEVSLVEATKLHAKLIEIYPELAEHLLDPTPFETAQAATATGQVRDMMPSLERRSAEYLDLADAAVKSALYALVSDGFQIAGYAGDEIALEVPQDAGAENTDKAERVAQVGVQQILETIPAACSATSPAHW